MDRLTFEELDDTAGSYDACVEQTPAIDAFCSSSMWILPASKHFQNSATAAIFRDCDAWVPLAQTRDPSGATILHSLESMWALPSSVIGTEPEGAVELTLRVMSHLDGWDVAFFTGASTQSPMWRRLVTALHRHFRVSRGPVTRRYLTRLTNGVDGFLKARSSGFRKNLQKARKRADARGLSFELADHCEPEDVDPSFERLLAIERRSWKGRQDVGIDQDPMRAFYRDMNRRLVQSGRRRLAFARLDDKDVAYIFGGLFAGGYRGLQFSYDADFRELSLGNLCQLHEIERLCAERVILYDLGTEVGYKRRWGEEVFATDSLIVHR